MRPPDSAVSSKPLFEYLRGLRRRFAFITVRDQGSGAQLPAISLDTIYVRTHLAKQSIPVERPIEEWPETTDVLTALSQAGSAAVIGDPGSGKSTMVSYLIQQLASTTENPVKTAFHNRIPFPLVIRELDLSDLRGWKSLLVAFAKWPGAASLDGTGRRGGAAELMHDCLRTGRALVLVDGFDEAPLDVRIRLQRCLAMGQRIYNGRENCWIVTSRPVGYDEAPFSIHYRSFRQLGAGELDKKIGELKVLFPEPEATEVAVSGVIELAKQRRADFFAPCLFLSPFRNADIVRYAERWFESMGTTPSEGLKDANEFLDRIFGAESLTQMARMPQMLALMCLVYKIDRALPNGRADLFERVTKVYLEQIPTAVRTEQAYPIQQAKQWLARVGFEMQRLRLESSRRAVQSAIIVDRTQILCWIEEEQRTRGQVEESAEQFLRFVSTHGGMFLERGEGKLAFLHLAFQEYFAALYLLDHLDWTPGASGWDDGQGDLAAKLREVAFVACGQIAWQETFVLLFELYRPKDAGVALKLLLERLMNVISDLTVQGIPRFTLPLGLLLSRVILDPKCDITAKVRSRAALEMLKCESRVQINHPPTDGDIDLGRASLCDISGLILKRLADVDSDEWDEVLSTFSVVDQSHIMIPDLSGLASLSELTSLRLSNVGGASLHPLLNCYKLRKLYLGQVDSSVLSEISKFQLLESLQFICAEQCDLTPLSDMSRLQTLDVEGKSLYGLDAVLRRGKIRKLSVTSDSLLNLSAIASCRWVSELRLVSPSVPDLGPIASLKYLEVLHLSFVGKIDLSPVSRVSGLRSLVVKGVSIQSTVPIGLLGNLRSLYLYRCSAADYAPLQQLGGLEDLNIGSTEISDLSWIANLRKLTSLSLRESKCSDLAPVAMLTRLKSLDLFRCPIEDVTPLSGLKELVTLSLEMTKVTDVSPLVSLKALQGLDLDGTPVSDVSCLGELRALKTLWLYNTNLSAVDLRELQLTLPQCHIHCNLSLTQKAEAV